MIPEALRKDLEGLEKNLSVEIIEEMPKIYVVLKNLAIPSKLYSLENTDVLIVTTAYYPKIGFDMFWTSPELRLKDDNIPKNAEAIETHLGKQWRRFSYHPYQNNPWNPFKDNVEVFVEHIKQRFRNGD